jgi:hypothetical protein
MPSIGPRCKLFRKNKFANKAKLAKKDAERFIQPKIELGTGRGKHVNLIVVVKRNHQHRNPSISIKRTKNREGNWIGTGSIDLDSEFEKEEERNLDIINKKLGKLRSGKNKGDKVVKYEVNNPPKKRYYPFTWK